MLSGLQHSVSPPGQEFPGTDALNPRSCSSIKRFASRLPSTHLVSSFAVAW